jgi:hypothetical protein
VRSSRYMVFDTKSMQIVAWDAQPGAARGTTERGTAQSGGGRHGATATQRSAQHSVAVGGAGGAAGTAGQAWYGRASSGTGGRSGQCRGTDGQMSGVEVTEP